MNTDLITKLVAQMRDELNDSKWYMARSDEASNGGNPRVAKGLEQIALEEFSHARFLRHVLISHDVAISPMDEQEYKNTWLLLGGRDD